MIQLNTKKYRKWPRKLKENDKRGGTIITIIVIQVRIVLQSEDHHVLDQQIDIVTINLEYSNMKTKKKKKQKKQNKR